MRAVTLYAFVVTVYVDENKHGKMPFEGKNKTYRHTYRKKVLFNVFLMYFFSLALLL